MTLNLSGPGTALEGLKEEPILLPCFSSSFKFLQIREPHGLGFLGLLLTKNKDFYSGLDRSRSVYTRAGRLSCEWIEWGGW